mmetsp:Transcript_114328/g.328440  ORF Transcript_114328/g.328440 Transcript_114328/m.328440 type:complete len:200 (+) Transcript_114328:144-743(+)
MRTNRRSLRLAQLGPFFRQPPGTRRGRSGQLGPPKAPCPDSQLPPRAQTIPRRRRLTRHGLPTLALLRPLQHQLTRAALPHSNRLRQTGVRARRSVPPRPPPTAVRQSERFGQRQPTPGQRTSRPTSRQPIAVPPRELTLQRASTNQRQGRSLLRHRDPPTTSASFPQQPPQPPKRHRQGPQLWRPTAAVTALTAAAQR